VVVDLLENGARVASRRDDLVSVLARFVDIWREGDIFAKAVTGSVFEA
jgi:hypothetical protein